jgi:hypothetical protein
VRISHSIPLTRRAKSAHYCRCSSSAAVSQGCSSQQGCPNDVKELDDWKRDANPYTVTLRFDGRWFTVPFFTGSGWTEEPTAADVMECLVSDARSVQWVDVDGWINDMGYEINSLSDARKAEATYKACERIAKGLEGLLGGDIDSVLEHSYRDDGELRRDDNGNVLVTV